MLDVKVQCFDSYWVASIYVGEIQPQAKVWIDDLLYFGARTPMACEADVRIFADNLPSPVENKISIHIETNERVYEEEVDTERAECWEN